MRKAPEGTRTRPHFQYSSLNSPVAICPDVLCHIPRRPESGPLMCSNSVCLHLPGADGDMRRDSVLNFKAESKTMDGCRQFEVP